MSVSEESQIVIDGVVDSVINYFGGDVTDLSTDIHFQPILSTGELVVLNDDEEEIAHVEIGCEDIAKIEDSLRSALEKRTEDFENLPLTKPFSCVLVDEQMETVSDLLLVDDDVMVVSNGLLEGLDEELNDFLSHLLED